MCGLSVFGGGNAEGREINDFSSVLVETYRSVDVICTRDSNAIVAGGHGSFAGGADVCDDAAPFGLSPGNDFTFGRARGVGRREEVDLGGLGISADS